MVLKDNKFESILNYILDGINYLQNGDVDKAHENLELLVKICKTLSSEDIDISQTHIQSIINKIEDVTDENQAKEYTLNLLVNVGFRDIITGLLILNQLMFIESIQE